MKKSNKKWLLSLMLVLVVSLMITGCTKDGDTQTGDPDTGDKVEDAAGDIKDSVDETVEEVEDDVRDMTYEDITLSPEDVFDKFMELHPDTKINQVDLDKELMDYQYVVEGYDAENDYEVKINPVDGEVISDDMEAAELDDEKGEITKEHLAKVDSLIDKAIEEDASDSRLDEWNVYVEDGKVMIDIEIGATEYSYDMDSEELIEDNM